MNETFYIKVTNGGPYLVYGNPSIDQEVIVPDQDGKSWTYRKGRHFRTDGPCALCRCGSSRHAPFCDGSHKKAEWEPDETAGFDPIMDNAELIEGPDVILADNEKYCAYARFCDVHGTVWQLVRENLNEDEKRIFAHAVEHCPGGRLMGRDRKTGKAFEPVFDPSIGLIQDAQIAISGPIWVKGGIRVESADGKSYEIRNRVTLCRCGQSSNKPFCDGTHVSTQYYDGLGFEADGKEW